MQIGFFSFVLEASLFLWKKCVYARLERCDMGTSGNMNLHLQRSMEQALRCVPAFVYTHSSIH
jgi:hypothetical protein